MDKMTFICFSGVTNSWKILGMGSGSAVEPQPEPHGKKSEPHARNRKIFNRTHGTAKFPTARTEPQKSLPHARNRNFRGSIITARTQIPKSEILIFIV